MAWTFDCRRTFFVGVGCKGEESSRLLFDGSFMVCFVIIKYEQQVSIDANLNFN